MLTVMDKMPEEFQIAQEIERAGHRIRRITKGTQLKSSDDHTNTRTNIQLPVKMQKIKLCS